MTSQSRRLWAAMDSPASFSSATEGSAIPLAATLVQKDGFAAESTAMPAIVPGPDRGADSLMKVENARISKRITSSTWPIWPCRYPRQRLGNCIRRRRPSRHPGNHRRCLLVLAYQDILQTPSAIFSKTPSRSSAAENLQTPSEESSASRIFQRPSGKSSLPSLAPRFSAPLVALCPAA
jgi:hypothetical protein